MRERHGERERERASERERERDLRLDVFAAEHLGERARHPLQVLPAVTEREFVIDNLLVRTHEGHVTRVTRCRCSLLVIIPSVEELGKLNRTEREV